MGNHQTQEQARKNHDWSLYNGGIDARSPVAISRFGILFKNLSLVATGGLILTSGLVLVGMWHTSGQFWGKLRSTFTISEPPAKIDVRSTVVQQVRGASELTTAVYSMETVVPASRERMIGGYVIGKTTLLYIAHGEVRAGVDLSTLRSEDVQVQGNTILLRLPAPKILDSKIDVNRSKVYDYDRGFMGLGPDVAPELQELAQRETLAKVVETACIGGVLQAANDRAKLAVSQLLSTAGYNQFTVETQAPTAEACVPSSAPLPSVTVPSQPLPSPLPSPTPDATVSPSAGQPAI